MDELKIRLQKKQPEIIGICETKLNNEIGDEAISINYNVIRRDREPNDGGGESAL